uniref:Fungal lipase-like domain-containing protein n=1 Tax=Oryza brachyantha TaxID=4533 RepID=J3LI88_ORYBR
MQEERQIPANGDRVLHPGGAPAWRRSGGGRSSTGSRRFGAGSVCIGGHSLGAGFALQVGKALAKQGVFVECHVFNPPSVSLAMSLKGFAEPAGELWDRVRSWLPTGA